MRDLALELPSISNFIKFDQTFINFLYILLFHVTLEEIINFIVQSIVNTIYNKLNEFKIASVNLYIKKIIIQF